VYQFVVSIQSLIIGYGVGVTERFVILVLVSVATAILGAVWVRRNAERLGLVSIPNDRSSHTRPTPHGGGLGIVMGGSVTGMWLAMDQPAIWWIIQVLALILAAVGLADDIWHLPARVRFSVQLILMSLLLWTLGLFSSTTLAVVILLLLTGVWWVNLFNFMDGIDGIAALQAMFMLLTGAMLAAWTHPEIIHSISFNWMLCLAAATAGFLMLNWPPARIFMGDVGSTYLAFMIYALAQVSVLEGWLTNVVWLILGAVFISDATATLMRRLLTGQYWYAAHRSHAYQRLAREFGSHRPVILLSLTINVFWLAPLASAALVWPQWAWYITILAYAPLLVGVLVLGAGKPDPA
jgi:Fuc2NAc and GlcNAc transferase